jgi:hypothetical protein
MRSTWILAVAAGAALSAAPVELAAQGRSGTSQRQEQIRAVEREAERERLRIEREREAQRQARTSTVRSPVYADSRRIDERDARRDDRTWGDIYGNSKKSNGNGPAFCRSGQGHPVHGREWCRDKGWGLGSDRDVFGDIIFRQPRDRRYDDRTLGRGTLGDILGSVILGRFESFGRNYGSGPLTGQWVTDYGMRTLQLNVSGVPIARLVDSNRDGRVDDVVLRR